MRKFFLFIVLLGLLACQNTSKFILSGNIEGLAVGDTLLLTEIRLPQWEDIAVDTFYVTNPNEFFFEKALSRTSFFLLSHTPKDQPKIFLPIRGGSILVKPGDKIELSGSVSTFGSEYKKGGFYNHPLISRLDSLENEENFIIIDIFNNYQKAVQENNQDGMQKYSTMYNGHRRSDELRKLKDYVKDSVNNNEYAAYLCLTNLHDMTGTELKEHIARFTPEVRASATGRKLENMLSILTNIEPGNKPQHFEVIDINGDKLALSDYAGKYTLIYHWGMCPGTIWIHPQLLELYERFHEKGFEVIGLTPSDFNEEYAHLIEIDNIKPLFNQPWRTVITSKEENSFITETYYLSGVPILMLISPDGTTLFRGYADVFADIKRTLEENL